MPYDGLKEWICEEAKGLGIDLIRFADASPLERTKFEIKRRFSSGIYHGLEGYRGIPKDDNFIRFRTEPASLVKGAKTIIVAAECYLVEVLERMECCAKYVGRIAKYTQYNAYKELKLKLVRLASLIDHKTGGKHKFAVRSNYGSIAEKEAAARSGIGFVGKNSLIITKEYGSNVVLGVIVTDLEIEPDKPLDISCGDCTLCIDACPTKAIARPYEVEIYKCLQFITERPYPLTDDILKKWGDRLYGCSTCQDVCPFNKGVRPVNRVPTYGVVGNKVDLISIINMNEDEFQRKFGDNQIGTRGLEVIKRNARIAVENARSKRGFKS